MACLVWTDAGQRARRLSITSTRETPTCRERRRSFAETAIVPGFEREFGESSWRRAIEARRCNQGHHRERTTRPSRRECDRGRRMALLVLDSGDRIAAQIRRRSYRSELGPEPEEGWDRGQLRSGIPHPARRESFVDRREGRACEHWREGEIRSDAKRAPAREADLPGENQQGGQAGPGVARTQEGYESAQ